MWCHFFSVKKARSEVSAASYLASFRAERKGRRVCSTPNIELEAIATEKRAHVPLATDTASTAVALVTNAIA